MKKHESVFLNLESYFLGEHTWIFKSIRPPGPYYESYRGARICTNWRMHINRTLLYWTGTTRDNSMIIRFLSREITRSYDPHDIFTFFKLCNVITYLPFFGQRLIPGTINNAWNICRKFETYSIEWLNIATRLTPILFGMWL